MIPSAPRIVVSVTEQPDGLFAASATLPSRSTINVLRKSREDAIRDCGEKIREVAPVPVVVVLPFCHPKWAMPWWGLPQFRAFDLSRSDADPEDDPKTPSGAVSEGDDGPVAVALDLLMGEVGA